MASVAPNIRRANKLAKLNESRATHINTLLQVESTILKVRMMLDQAYYEFTKNPQDKALKDSLATYTKGLALWTKHMEGIKKKIAKIDAEIGA